MERISPSPIAIDVPDETVGKRPHGWPGGLDQALDRPARAALRLGRTTPWSTLAMGLLGMFAIAAACLATRALLAPPGPGRLDGLLPFMEAVASLVPIALVAAYLQVAVPPRVLAGAVAVGLLHAGLVALSLVPLAVFVAVITDLGVFHRTIPMLYLVLGHLVLPAVALVVLAQVIARVLRCLDGSLTGRLVAHAIPLCLIATFVLRVAQLG